MSAANTSAPPRAPALTATAEIDTRRGMPEATRYEASPSMMPNGSGALPTAMTSALTTVTAASTGTGRRRSAAIGRHTANARTRRWPRSCGPAETAIVIRAAHKASKAMGSHWGHPDAAGARGGASAE